MRAAILIDGVGAARKDNALGLELQLSKLLSAWEHLREDIELAQTTSNAFTEPLSVCSKLDGLNQNMSMTEGASTHLSLWRRAERGYAVRVIDIVCVRV